MRFLIYILILAGAVSFFVFNHKTEPAPAVSVELTATTSPIIEERPQVDTSSTTRIESKISQPKIKPQPQLDAQTLKQIQDKLNQASQTLKGITEKTATPPKIRLAQAELYTKAATRVVNFFCQHGNSAKVASGIIISPTGYILTNAHVAEGFDKDYLCLIRQGSPARNVGYAQIVMFPKAYGLAADRQAQAENDVSIWKLVQPSGTDPLPSTFDYYDINPKNYPELNSDLVTFSYPSELLGYETVLKSLNMFFADTTVTDFDQDLIVSGSGLSSQVGSSGGILVDPYTNQFAGLIFGVSKDETINQRKLFSLTPYSVARVTQAETGMTLDVFLKR